MGMRTRLGRILVHGAVCGFGVLRSDGVYGGMDSTRCRGGCDTTESPEYVILDCPCYLRQRSRVRDVCLSIGIDFDVQNAVVHPKVLPWTEEIFLSLHGKS